MSKKDMKKKIRKAGKNDSCCKTGAAARLNDLKDLVDLMVTRDLVEVDISEGDSRICVKRGVPAGAVPAFHAAVPVRHGAATHAAPAAAEAAGQPEEKFSEIKSPMVGTFYSSPSPDSDPFVKVGMAVASDSVVCIVEAMKVMNEIKAECSGTIVEICVKNAQPVEFGQVLFRVKPS